MTVTRSCTRASTAMRVWQEPESTDSPSTFQRTNERGLISEACSLRRAAQPNRVHLTPNDRGLAAFSRPSVARP